MIRARVALALAVVALGATPACSRDDANVSPTAGTSPPGSAPPRAGKTASCDRVPSTSLCSEYGGMYLAQNEAVLSSQCGKLGGTFVHAECPNTAVLGSCLMSTTEVRKFYASGSVEYDVARAEKECAGIYKGRWTPFR